MVDCKIAVGLVVKGGKQFIKDWLESANIIADIILVIDNDADKEVKNILIKHPKVKQYHVQHFPYRNMSRDYQKILDYAREEKCDWIWIMDIDKYIPKFNVNDFKAFLVNTKITSIGFPLFEMREDIEHYVMVKDIDSKLKHARLCHEMYKVLNHYSYDVRDEHSGVIPQNCIPSEGFLPISIFHLGHMTKELREEKRQKYIKDKELFGYDDKGELEATWMEEDNNNIVIKNIKDFNWRELVKNEKY